MKLQGSDQAGIIAVGVGALVAVAAALFKAANLRGDSNSKWSSRVDLAAGALDEKTVAELQLLRADIDRLLPDTDEPFEPAQAIVDPSPLSARVEKTAKYYRARVRMGKNLNRVRRLGRVFVGSLILIAFAVVLLTVYYAELLSWNWIRPAGLVIGGLGVFVVILAMSVYIFWVDRLSGDEILADTAAEAGKGGGDG